MCFKTILVVSRPRSNITRRRQRNPANLRPISTSSTTPLSFSMALRNCQSTVNKADLIYAFSLQSTLSILGLTETWIRPEDSSVPVWLSGRALRQQRKRLWVRFPGNTHTDEIV